MVTMVLFLAMLAVAQIKMAGMNVKDFWSFIKANDTLNKLYAFSIKYDQLTPQQQVLFLQEADTIFDAFEKVPDALWEEEYQKYMEILNKYKDIKINEEEKTFTLGGYTFHEGDYISLDGTTGKIYNGDIISLHIPSTNENHHMLDEQAFNQMKKDATLQAAISAVKNGETITFLDDITEDVTEDIEEPMPLKGSLVQIYFLDGNPRYGY